MNVKKIAAGIILLSSLNAYIFAEAAAPIAFSANAFRTNSFEDSVMLTSSKPKPPKKDNSKDEPPPPKKDKDKKNEPPPPKKNGNKHHERRHHRKSVSEEVNETLTEFFADLIAEIIAIIWADNNLYASFEEYPYQYGSDYIHHPDAADYVEYEFAGDPAGTRPFRYAAGTEFFYDSNTAIGNTTYFEGLFYRFFGPVIENTVYTDRSFNAFTGNLKLGGRWAILQWDYLSIYNIFQWDHWYGDNVSHSANNFAFTFEATSYPFDPLVLNYKYTLTGESNRYRVDEHIVSVGFMNKRDELYVKYIFRDMQNYGIHSYTHSGVLGTRIYF